MTTPTTQSLLDKFDELGDSYLRDEVEQALLLKEEITPLTAAGFYGMWQKILWSIPWRCAMPMFMRRSLLSEFREPAAHELFIRAFLIPEEQLVDIWGDLTTETLPTFLYRTCSDSLEPIKALVVNREADQFVRCAGMEALSYVVAFDPSKRGEVLSFLQSLFTGEEAAQESYFWGNLTATLCDLHPGESMECIQGAFDKKAGQ